MSGIRSLVVLSLILGVATGAAAFGQSYDSRRYDGGDWRADRIRRGLVPDPTAADYEKAVAEWKGPAGTDPRKSATCRSARPQNWFS